MGSLNRSIRRKQEVKKRKALKKGLKQVLEATAGMPTKCTLCSEPFSKESDPDAWYMNIKENKIVLTCPVCSQKSQKK
jgi:5-formyltetrahydrofolate cyclo-ligase